MSLDALLQVQAHDSAIDRLRHRRENLPEFAALADCDEESTHLNAARAQVQEQRDHLRRDQKRLEDEVALIEERHKSEQGRLYSGSVTAHKDLQAIQAELEVLASRQSDLEDQVLEVMEATEPIAAQLVDLDAKLADVEDRQVRIQDEIAQAQAGIDAEIAAEAKARESEATDIDQDLMGDYDRTRAQCGGIGVSRLVNKTCEGCHLQLAAVELDRIRKEPPDARIHCECGRILVR